MRLRFNPRVTRDVVVAKRAGEIDDEEDPIFRAVVLSAFLGLLNEL